MKHFDRHDTIDKSGINNNSGLEKVMRDVIVVTLVTVDMLKTVVFVLTVVTHMKVVLLELLDVEVPVLTIVRKQ